MLIDYYLYISSIASHTQVGQLSLIVFAATCSCAVGTLYTFQSNLISFRAGNLT